MAIAVTKPTSQVGITSNIAVYSMAPTFLPSSGALLVVLTNASATLTGSISGNGNVPWSYVASLNPQNDGAAARIFTGAVPDPPSSVSVNVDFTGDNATGCTAVALQVTEQSGVNQIVQVQSVGANPQITFPQAVGSANAYIVGVLFTSALVPFTPPAGWTTVSASYATPTTGLAVGYRATGESGQTFTFSTGAVTGLAMFGVEVAWNAPAVPQAIFDPMGMCGIFGQ